MDHLPQYSAEEVVAALRRREEMTARGHTLAEVAAQLNISRETLTNWRRDFDGMSPAAVAEAREVRQRNGYSNRRKKVKGSTKLRPYAPTLSAEDRRNQVLDGGLRVLVEQGPHAVSLHTVGRQLNLSRPPIARQFPDSEQLRQAVIDREVTAAVEELATIMPPEKSIGSPPHNVAEAVVEQFLAALVATPYRWEAMAQLARSPISLHREQVRPALHSVIVAFIGGRYVRGDSADAAAHLILALILEVADLVYADRTRGTADTLQGSLIEAIAALTASRRSAPS